MKKTKGTDASGDMSERGESFGIRRLTMDEVRTIYKERFVLDFPKNEQKTLALIERALNEDRYVCYGAKAGKETQAYAFFALCGRWALFDYYAVRSDLRCRGLGSRFLQALIKGPLTAFDCVLLEVDDPAYAPDARENERRLRRLRFYLKNGLRDTGATAVVWHVEFRILSLPGKRLPSAEETAGIYASLYRSILPERIYSRMVSISPDPPRTERAD